MERLKDRTIYYLMVALLCCLTTTIDGQSMEYFYTEQNVQVDLQGSVSEQSIGFYLPVFIPPNILGRGVKVDHEGVMKEWPTSWHESINPGLYYSQNRRRVYRDLFYQIILYADPDYDYNASIQLLEPILLEWPVGTDPDQILQEIEIVNTIGTFGAMLNSNFSFLKEVTKAGLAAEEAEFRAILSFVAFTTFAVSRMNLVESYIARVNDPEMKNGFYLAKQKILEEIEQDREELRRSYQLSAAGQSLSKGLPEIATSSIVGAGVKALLTGAGAAASFTALALPAALLHGLNRQARRDRSEAMSVGLASIDENIFRNYILANGLESELMEQMGYRVQKMISELAGEYSSLIDPNVNYVDGTSGREYRQIAERINQIELTSLKPNYDYALINEYLSANHVFSKDADKGDGLSDYDVLRDPNTEIVEVTSQTGRVWMDRNLGASRAATSSTDEQAYGDLYQWGRAADGHQRRNSSTNTDLSYSDQPGHGSFILVSSNPWDWRSPQNDNLWQGTEGMNNPCPQGFRIPTNEEWDAELQSWSSDNAAGAYASPLKLTMGGMRSSEDGLIGNIGSIGYYWSSTTGARNIINGTTAFLVVIFSDMAHRNILDRSRPDGFTVRCIKD